MDNVTKALALARLGIKVFPVSVATRAPAIPVSEGGRGFYDATSDDFEKIATWFTMDYVGDQYAVGYWAGGSGLLIADLDRGKKNGKDGFKSIAEQERSIGDTYFYKTRSGGEHHIFQTDRIDLTLDTDHDGAVGVDVRAGGSYAVWWGDEVPDSRDVFSTDIPEWLTIPVEKEPTGGGGFSGSVEEWLTTVSADALPSMRVRDMIARIPSGEFGHPEMTDLAWAIVRLGSERETGIKMALESLRKAWLREPYNTPKFRRDLDLALRGAINKAGRVQKPVPSMPSLSAALTQAKQADVYDELTAVERKVSETASEIDLARARREMFALAAKAGMKAGAALGVVTGSRAFKQSKVTVESAWFGDGESEFSAVEEESEPDEDEEYEDEEEVAKKKLEKLVARLSSDSQAFSLLDSTEKALLETAAYRWFGDEYLDYIKAQLKHFNRPYHVAMLWAALSVIASPWGKVPLPGAKAVDVNLYMFSGGDSSTGKTEAVEFGTELIDAVYGKEFTPIRGDISKLSALALHRDLILRDGKPSLIFGDEIQSFFEGVQGQQWQNGILGDVSSHYGGNVSPKLTLNDKDISGKRAKTMLTSYLTGIADQTLAAVSLRQWTSGFFYRFLWSFGNPRINGDHSFKMKTSTASYTAQFDVWAKELKRVGALQEVRWGAGREVYWDEDAEKRMEQFKEQIEGATIGSPLFDTVYSNANTRFALSIAKVATIIAMVEASETVTLKHVLIALSYAGPWHRSMVLAVEETAKEPFDRDAEACLDWIRRNAVEQHGKAPWIQESAVYRAFRPNEVAERLLRQLTKEGWIQKSGDKYELLAE